MWQPTLSDRKRRKETKIRREGEKGTGRQERTEPRREPKKIFKILTFEEVVD